jgi:hypothetical protein
MANKYTSEGWPNNIGKRGKLVSPDKRVSYIKIIDEIRKQQSTYPPKVIYLQLVQLEGNRIELRLCYYIVGKIGRTKGKWVFGQFATLLPTEDFQVIINEAKLRNWF